MLTRPFVRTFELLYTFEHPAPDRALGFWFSWDHSHNGVKATPIIALPQSILRAYLNLVLELASITKHQTHSMTILGNVNRMLSRWVVARELYNARKTKAGGSLPQLPP